MSYDGRRYDSSKVDKQGRPINGRGDRTSAKRVERRQLCAQFGVTTGRQWVRLRRAIRREAKRAREVATQGKRRG